MHVLGNSLGGRIGIELAALSPSGPALPAEGLHQGFLMATARRVTRTLRPVLGSLARTPAGRPDPA